MNQKIRKYRLLVFMAAVMILLAGQVYPASAAVTPIRVPANVEWVSTGIWLESGQTVHLSAQGLAITGPITSILAHVVGLLVRDGILGAANTRGRLHPARWMVLLMAPWSAGSAQKASPS